MVAAGCAQSTKNFAGDPVVMDYAMDDVVPGAGEQLAAGSDAAIAGDIEDDDFMQMAAIEEEALDDMRGGFISAGGMKFNFGFVAETVVDGAKHIRSELTLSGLQSGDGMSSKTFTDVDGLNVKHMAGKSGIMAEVTNTGSDRTIQNVNSITIDIVEFSRNIVQRPRSGSPLGANKPRLPVDVQRAYQGAISR